MKNTISIICALFTLFTAFSQRYVPEDDIYYSPSDKDEIVEKMRKERAEEVRTYTVTETPVTETKVTESPVTEAPSNDFDVDAYNRRYSTTTYDTATYSAGDTIASYSSEIKQGMEVVRQSDDIGDINYSELIRRFHNPETGTYILDSEYNTLYLIDDYDSYYPSSTNVYITGSSWYDPFYTPWGWTYGYNNWWGWNSYWYPTWGWNMSWYWNPYYPYYPYYPPYLPHYRPPRPHPAPSYPSYRPAGNYGGRYTPGSSVGTGGRTDGATRYEYTRPSNGISTGIYSGNRTTTGTRSYGGRTSSGGSNRNSSVSGGSYVRPSYTPQNNTYRQTSPSVGGGGGIRSSAPVGTRGGSNIGGRGSR